MLNPSYLWKGRVYQGKWWFSKIETCSWAILIEQHCEIHWWHSAQNPSPQETIPWKSKDPFKFESQSLHSCHETVIVHSGIIKRHRKTSPVSDDNKYDQTLTVTGGEIYTSNLRYWTWQLLFIVLVCLIFWQPPAHM